MTPRRRSGVRETGRQVGLLVPARAGEPIGTTVHAAPLLQRHASDPELVVWWPVCGDTGELPLTELAGGAVSCVACLRILGERELSVGDVAEHPVDGMRWPDAGVTPDPLTGHGAVDEWFQVFASFTDADGTGRLLVARDQFGSLYLDIRPDAQAGQREACAFPLDRDLGIRVIAAISRALAATHEIGIPTTGY